MANKAAAKASAAWAARAKKDGFPIRRETRCHCGHMISLKAVGRHNCSSVSKYNSSRGLPSPEKTIFKSSLRLITSRAQERVSKRSEREQEIVRQIDRSISRPATLPNGWRGTF